MKSRRREAMTWASFKVREKSALSLPGKRAATVADLCADFSRTLKEANVIASLRRDFIRFSPHLYDSPEDIGQALSAIKAAL